MSMRKNLWAPCLALSLLGCGGSETPGMVGQAGGTITNAMGAKITIPKAALSRDVAITIKLAATQPTLTNATALGSFFELGPDGQTFALPVEVTLPFDPAKMPAGASVVIYTAPTGSSAFTSLGGMLVDAPHVRAATTHFSTFGAGAPMAVACTDGASCDDANPCTSNDVCTGGKCAGTAYTCPTATTCLGNGSCSTPPAEVCGNG